VSPCGGKNGQQRLVGFCQALLPFNSNPKTHTESFSSLLCEVGSTFAHSHELFLGHCLDLEKFNDWFAIASAPLEKLGRGCIPVLITGLTVNDARFIFDSGAHELVEPVLVRLIVDGDFEPVVRLMQNVTKRVLAGEMPAFYPLLQASTSTDSVFWDKLRSALGSTWQYTCVAIDPWVNRDTRAIVREQTVVAQVPIGDAAGLGEVVSIPEGILGAWPEGAKYDFTQYISSFDDDDIVIVLGPSRPDWSKNENQSRIRKVVRMLTEAGIPA
jgi:hypothetical protein